MADIKKEKMEIKQTIYKHGGSRIYFSNEEIGDRLLILDTYSDKKFARAVFRFCEKYFERDETDS